MERPLSPDILKAVEVLRKQSAPHKIILFGSQARGTARADSDVDFLIIKTIVKDRRREIMNLRRTLLNMGIHADILIVTTQTFEEWCETPGNIYFEAAQDGKVMFSEEAA